MFHDIERVHYQTCIRKEIIMRKQLLSLSVILLLAVMGCESNLLKPLASDSGKDARIEDAKMALDDGNYQEVISDLSGENTSDPEIAGLLSSAYMGHAGLDLTNLIEKAGSSAENFDIIASAFNLQGGTSSAVSVLNKSALSAQSTPGQPIPLRLDRMIEILTDLAMAEKYLNQSLLLPANQNNDDLKVQLGVCAALHFILDIGYVVAKVEGLVTGTGATATINIPVSEAAYKSIFTGKDITELGAQMDAELDSNADGKDAFNGNLDGLRDDLLNIYTAVEDVFIKNLPNEDITNDFNEFMSEIVCPSGGSCNINSAINLFTASTLAEYIDSQLVGN
jgi:hypothetical protein